MKKNLVILISFSCLFLNLNAQDVYPPDLEINKSTGRVIYDDVIEIAGASKDELYRNVEAWFNTYFKNPTSVIQGKDAESGKITGKHAINIYRSVKEKGEMIKKNAGMIKYSIKVLVKPERYKYVITDIFKVTSPKLYIAKWLDENDPAKALNYDYLEQIDEHMQRLIANLTDYIEEEVARPDEEAEEDW